MNQLPKSMNQLPKSMNQLPDELIAKIIEYIHITRSLYSLSLVSQRFYRITLPFLYAAISHYMYQEPKRLQSAIRTLIRRPDLAAKVQHVALRDPRQNDSFFDLKSWAVWAAVKYNATLEGEDASRFFTAANNLIGNLSARDSLVQKEEAHAALLVALVPSLKHLHIENPNLVNEQSRFGMDHLILDILQPQIKSGKILQNLERLTAVTARMEGGQGGFRLSSIASFFLLPKLRSVIAVACFEPEDDLFVNFDPPRRSSAVRELRFLRSAICPLGLKKILECCRAVEIFDCDWAGLSVGWVEINFPLLLEALEHHKNTLTELTLDTAKHFDSWPESEDGLVPPLGPALHTFENLRKLDVPASALIGYDEYSVGGYGKLKDILPPNLEELKLNEFAPRLVGMVEELVPHCTTLLPNLRKLTISRIHAGATDVEDDLERKFREMAPVVQLSFVDRREIDHFEGSIGRGGIEWGQSV
ncbi:hypothetical protein E6O75_ATG01737 [Venturia nashicola]|uniref:F-box domain-containing protein n=1 Tax=Venturia nashicola TaxID=86259 RepID=A0A4Z1NGW5_9PEZI|nr:hypothetical protein E6O75_ATG01737 [Venturia nashicola]